MADFDFGAFLQSIGASGQEFAYDILSEQQKHKKKMEERLYKETQRQKERERDRKNTRREFGMGILGDVLAGDYNVHTKRRFTQWGIEQGWIDPGILGLGTTPPPAMPKAEFGTPEYWQMGAQMDMAPMPKGEIDSYGQRMFGTPAVAEPKPLAATGDKRLFAPAPSKPKTPTPVAPEKIREQAYRLTTSIMRGPQFQELLSGLDPKARIKFEKDFRQMLERTHKFLQEGQFPEMRRTEEEWDELYEGELYGE